MKLISVQIPEKYVEIIDILVEMGFYANRSEAIRISVRDLAQKELGPIGPYNDNPPGSKDKYVKKILEKYKMK